VRRRARRRAGIASAPAGRALRPAAAQRPEAGRGEQRAAAARRKHDPIAARAVACSSRCALQTIGPLVSVGRWEGEVLATPRGDGGFGPTADLHPGIARSVAELDAATKNAHSHRARAARAMLAAMREAWQLG
jgi:inosine/xanthosine triphosphate pyrophosphatase family protein